MIPSSIDTTAREPETIVSISHRNDEYDENDFAILDDMQERHFWYRGRHRFLLSAVKRHLSGFSSPRVIDMGGGCGGWLAYLARRKTFPIGEMALADSSSQALDRAKRVLPNGTRTFQVDLLNPPWENRWDVAFLLDVLEHIPADEDALRRIYQSLAPGGILFVTTPALRVFWSWNDEVVHHVRRYSKSDFKRLAAATGFCLIDARYFMFLLSPLRLATRFATRAEVKNMTEEHARALMKRMHRVPSPPLNVLLGAIFAGETPLGHILPFPWGSSILAVLQKPRES